MKRIDVDARARRASRALRRLRTAAPLKRVRPSDASDTARAPLRRLRTAAPLKRRSRRESRTSRTAASPPSSDGGSVEAQPAASDDRTRLMPLRRLRTAAPLKHGLSAAPCCGAAARPLRRLRTAAPLKRRRSGRDHRFGTGSPPSSDGGSVEALASRIDVTRLSVSPPSSDGGSVEARLVLLLRKSR